jgi:hypothetical protein
VHSTPPQGGHLHDQHTHHFSGCPLHRSATKGWHRSRSSVVLTFGVFARPAPLLLCLVRTMAPPLLCSWCWLLPGVLSLLLGTTTVERVSVPTSLTYAAMRARVQIGPRQTRMSCSILATQKAGNVRVGMTIVEQTVWMTVLPRIVAAPIPTDASRANRRTRDSSNWRDFRAFARLIGWPPHRPNPAVNRGLSLHCRTKPQPATPCSVGLTHPHSLDAPPAGIAAAPRAAVVASRLAGLRRGPGPAPTPLVSAGCRSQLMWSRKDYGQAETGREFGRRARARTRPTC